LWSTFTICPFRGADPPPLAGKAAFAEEVAGAEHRHHSFPAGLREHRQLDAALLDVHDGVARVALGEHDLVAAEFDDLLRQSRRVEKLLRVEGS
jgi:hypothetical protein